MELYIFYSIRFYHLHVIIFRNSIEILEEISNIFRILIEVLSLVVGSNLVGRTIFIKEIPRKLECKRI